MAELKTKVNDESVMAFLSGVSDEKRRQDCLAILQLMKDSTKAEPKMWGSSIVGFGSYHYKGVSGREGDWFVVGFSPRKQNLTLYVMTDFEECQDLLAKLGKHTSGKSCLYINSLDQIDRSVLKKLLARAVKSKRKVAASE